MMKRVVKSVLLLLLVVVMASCSSEQRALSHMRSLTAQIEKKGQDYSIEEWKDAYYEFKEIDDSVNKDKFSPKQKQEYTELQARCVKSFAKSSVKAVKDGISTYIKEGIDIVKGVIDGILE